MTADLLERAWFIAVDWGTTNFRAALVDRDGEVLDRMQAPRGILHVARGGFADAFRELLAPWLDAPARVAVVMSGMVGSADGLVEVPYLPCPVGLDDVADAMVEIPDLGAGRRVLIVPGLSGRSVAGSHDVMRGEEIQIIGAIGEGRPAEQVFCLPGTHSKWVSLNGRLVTAFSTSMTGDAFAALRDHTILSRFAAGGRDSESAFRRGVAHSGRPGGLLHHLFSGRSEVLLGDLSAEDDASYLSGLLVGHETRAMTAALAVNGPVAVIGSGQLNALYGMALEALGVAVHPIDGNQSAVRGLAHLARRCGV
ncbi:MAG TPA: 2-dehydro-3-deoxygalactonokinase [Gammaproteobacteria bacterium]|nr:2-dehydro-3-deoxygalactonokinase [Gammaproteobacteria bacterium]